MKKGVVLLFVVLALVVLVSPGLVGRLAERSVDEGIRAGTIENEDVIVSAELFERGWFTTEGQHRIELKDGAAAAELRTVLGLAPDDALPAFVVTTRIDHGLIPIASLGREDGSLAPGLGDAVSTVAIEMPDGTVFDVPGAVHSHIGLAGSLASTYDLPGGSIAEIGQGIEWGDGRIDLTTNARSGRIEIDAEIERFEVLGNEEASLRVHRLTAEGVQQPSGFGFALGEGRITVESMNTGGPAIGPLDMAGEMAIQGDKLEIDFELSMTSATPGFGAADTSVVFHARDLDPEAFGAFIRKYQVLANTFYDPADATFLIETEAQALMASGLSFEVPNFDIALPDGTFRSSLNVDVAASGDANVTWSSLLLATEADASVRIPEALLETLLALNPNAGALIGLGYLRPDNGDYISDVRYAKGILTINGAPMALPLNP